jgi:hypothetical protein
LEEKNFTARILRPKTEGILLAMWKTGKISFLAQPKTNLLYSIEIRSNLE